VSEQELPARKGWFSRSGTVRLLLPLATVAVLQAESQWVLSHLLGINSPVEEPGPQICLLLAILALLAFLPRLLSALASLAVTLIMTAIWLVDANYYRFFRELPSWHLLPTWRQAGKASQSLSSLLDPGDLVILLGPLLIAVLALLAWGLRRKRPADGLLAPALAALVALGASLYTVHALPEVRWIQLQRRFQNIAMAKIFGPLYYHAYDTYEYGRIQLGLEGGRRYDAAKVKAALGKSRELSTRDTPFKGMFEGRDLLFFQLESLEYFALEAEVKGRPVMPFMQKLARAGYAFRLFDQTHLGRSSDGQFIYLNSLHPPADRPLAFTYPNNHFHGLPKLFADKGYETVYMHPSDPSFWNAKLMATAYGFQTLLFRDQLPARDSQREIRGWGLSDDALFRRVVEHARGNGKPAFYYVVTMMCHHPYPETPMEDTSFPSPRPESMVRRYLRCCNARDKAIAMLVQELGKTERGRRTVLVLVGDHDSNVTESEKRHLGLPAFPDSEAVPLVICTVESAMTGKPMLEGDPRPPVAFGAQMDLAPSLGHVFSLAMEKSVFLGWNLFAKQNSGPRMSRLGTWMDDRGTIKPPEDHSEALDTTEFEVSEMLLQGDRIEEIHRSL
jgi:phosphoglycerol transferase MdoB-like AlkP superfamily enzyme